MKTPIMTLLTDFGSRDPFVGVMKGVILSICPQARLVDLTHEVPPQAVMAGAYLLKTSIGYFPPGTIHLCVVDPGVGSARKCVVLKSQGHFFVGPDNGLFSAALKDWGIEQVVELTDKKFQLPNPSTTFHGRDIFAPAAAHLAKGVPLLKLGNRINHWVWRELPKPFRTKAGWTGEVLWIDRFGNLITNLEAKHIPKPFRMKIGKTVVLHVATHYSQIKKGTVAVLVGSSGNLEVSVNGGSAAQKLGAKIGSPVTLG
ncbi:MAG TPA: SAM-dependent chlorinase/fluorinase [bacterium]|nr:SAM-dependent chlorinase/fluorinase [bacterium]